MTEKDTVVVAHYYATEEVKAMADRVGDSLDLAMWVSERKPERVVFASVRFMAETAKILNPEIEVILPDGNATCSLVEQTDLNHLRTWNERAKEANPNVKHVMYINSSAEMKSLADIIVTSRIVDDVISTLYKRGKSVIFSPDANMGKYLNHQYGYNMPVYTSVCEVHDKFKAEEIDNIYRHWTNGAKFLLAHPESPLPVLERADYIGSTHGMLNWVKEHPYDHSTIFVATEEGLLHNMRVLRPTLDIKQAPIYSGCQCNSCPYMKLNTPLNVLKAKTGIGTIIDDMSKEEMESARKPIERMLEFQKSGDICL